MSEETKQNEGEDRQEQSELSDDQLEQAAGGAVDSFSKPQKLLKVGIIGLAEVAEKVTGPAEIAEKVTGPAEGVGNNFEEIKVTYTEYDSE